MGDRCTGQCCKRFYLPLSMEELQAMAAQARAGEHVRFELPDLFKVAEMAIELDTEQRPGKDPAHYFTCKHHDAATGNCNNYADRPFMCSDYPYGEPCHHGSKCEWDAARDGLVPNARLLRIRAENLAASGCDKATCDEVYKEAKLKPLL